MSSQRVLVTGASGFIGASLTRELIAGGCEVHAVLRPASSRWRLAALEGQYAAHQADLRDLPALRRAVDACRPDVIYHLAADGTVGHNHDHATLLASNLAGTSNLLDALAPRDYQVLVQAGSSSEYGFQAGAIREDQRLEPRSVYAVSKAAATLLVQAEAFRGRPVTTVRIFSAYGPWEDSRRLVPYLMYCCLRGERPRVTEGRQPRDFIHVDDCVALLKRAATNPAARGQILHAGSGRRQTVRGMVALVVRLCSGGRLSPEFGAEPTRADEPLQWLADIARTTHLIGWRPQVATDDGIRRTWHWYREHSESTQLCRAA